LLTEVHFMPAPTRLFGRLGIALVATLVLASAAFAQNAGSLRGIVSDPSGGVLPGATVVLTNEATRENRQAQTDSRGGYFFAAVPPGVYTVRIEMPGFKKAETKGIRMSANAPKGLDCSRMIDIGSNSGLIIAPNTDFVSEVKVQSSNYAAEFGSGGIQVNAITKGGSSEFHGSAYSYVRHHKFAANDRSNSIAGVEKPKSKFVYPGANISGPILIPAT